MVASPDVLVPDARLKLPGQTGEVVLVQARDTGSGQFWTLVFKDRFGVYGEITLSLDELPSIEMVEETGGVSFDSDASRFRLGIEATPHSGRLAARHGGPGGIEHRAAAPPARSGLRRLPRPAPTPIPPGRRPRCGQDHHGGPLHQGASTPPGCRPGAHCYPGQPPPAVAAGAVRAVRHRVRPDGPSTLRLLAHPEPVGRP